MKNDEKALTLSIILQITHKKIEFLYDTVKAFYFQLILNLKNNAVALDESKTFLDREEVKTTFLFINSAIPVLVGNKIISDNCQKKLIAFEDIWHHFYLLIAQNTNHSDIDSEALKYLRTAIFNLIILKNEISIVTLEPHNKPSENHPDLCGDALYFPIEYYPPTTNSPIFLESYLHDEKNIFRHDKSFKRTFLTSLAAIFGFDLALEAYILAAIKQQNDVIDYKIWLHLDDTQQTLLHHVIKSTNIDAYSILYKYIVTEKNYLEIINQADMFGNTPLHAACISYDPSLKGPSALLNIKKMIKSLVSIGATIDLVNEANHTPFSYLPKTIIIQFAKEGILIDKTLPKDIIEKFSWSEIIEILPLTSSLPLPGSPAEKYYEHLSTEGSPQELAYVYNQKAIGKNYSIYLASKNTLFNLVRLHVNFNKEIKTHEHLESAKHKLPNEILETVPVFAQKNIQLTTTISQSKPAYAHFDEELNELIIEIDQDLKNELIDLKSPQLLTRNLNEYQLESTALEKIIVKIINFSVNMLKVADDLQDLLEKITKLHEKLKLFHFDFKKTNLLPEDFEKIIIHKDNSIFQPIKSDMARLVARKILSEDHAQKILKSEYEASQFLLKWHENFLFEKDEIIPIIFPHLCDSLIYLSILKNELMILRDNPNFESSNDPALCGKALNYVSDSVDFNFANVYFILLHAYLRDEKNIFRNLSNSKNIPKLIHTTFLDNFFSLLELFITSAISQKKYFLDYKIWLYPDTQGETLLHNISQECDQLSYYRVLYKYIIAEHNYLEILNQTSNDKNTALHYACRKYQLIIDDEHFRLIYSEIIKSLVFTGVDITCINHKNKTPFSYLTKEAIMVFAEEGLFIGKIIPVDVKEILINGGITEIEFLSLTNTAFASASPAKKYYEYLSKNGNPKELAFACNHPTISKDYFAYLASQKTLLQLVTTQVNFNSNIQPKNPKKIKLPVDVLEKIPYFSKKKSDIPDKETVQVNTDIKNLDELSDQLKKYLQFLKSQTAPINFNRHYWNALFERINQIVTKINLRAEFEKSENVKHVYAKVTYVTDEMKDAATNLKFQADEIKDISNYDMVVVEKMIDDIVLKLNLIKKDMQKLRKPISLFFKPMDELNKDRILKQGNTTTRCRFYRV